MLANLEFSLFYAVISIIKTEERTDEDKEI